MAQISYAWNPFQERVDCNIIGEIIKPTGAGTRMEFVPRAAPFFAKDFKLYRQGSTTPLKPGIDYVFGHPFDRFIKGDATTPALQRNVYGSVILLKADSAQLRADYGTIGGPFMLDEAAYVTLVANIVNSPRQALWEDLVNVPVAFPPLPHPHPAAQVYDFLQMLDYLKNLLLAVTETGSDQVSLKTILEEHLAKSLPEAHAAAKGDLALDLVDNNRTATIADLAGNSATANVSIEVLKEAFRRFQANTLDLNS